MGCSARRMAMTWRAVGLAVVYLLAAAPGASFAQTPAASPAPAASQAPAAPKPSPAIPPSEVAAKSTEVTNLLAALSAEFAPSSETEKIEQSFYKASSEIERDFFESSRALQGQPSLAGLQAQQALWKPRQVRLNGWLNLLTLRAVELRGMLTRLQDLQTTWTRTREAARASQAPAATLQQVATVLIGIEAAQVSLRARSDALLGLQSRVSEELSRCDDIIARIAQAQKGAVAGILTRGREPIWDPSQWVRARTALPARIGEILADLRKGIGQYVRDPSKEMPLQIGLFVLLAVVFSAARRLVRRWAADDKSEVALASVFERPYAAALFSVWFVASRYDSPTPQAVKELFAALAIIPIVRLVQPVISSRLLPVIYTLGGLYALDLIREVIGETGVVEQTLLLLEGMAGGAVVGWLLVSRRLHAAFAVETGARRIRALVAVCKGAMLFFAGGVAAAALGHLGLARILTSGTISVIELSLALYAALRVFGGAVAAALRLWPLRLLHMVRQHRDFIEKRAYRLLVWMAVLGWAARSLDRVGLLDPIVSTANAILSTKLERGSISVSIEDILAFGLTIWASYLLSGLIRFTLQEEVYSRARVPSGTAYATSRLLHYTVLALGFVIGLGVLGMDLTKVSVMAGAFGVGIGFGLQSVVNNFVCGLILLFERPIHVGDTIEAGELLGEVRRIGFRASTVRTRQGADIIIPNAQFITANVTNWTYSDRLRRIDLPVGVAYASAPKQVIELLREVAGGDPHVLQNPPPICLFMGYGDSSINFELRVWTNQFSDYAQVRSELNSAIYDAVTAAGMSFPFPQREVRLLRDPGDAARAPALTEEPPGPSRGSE